jgi:hypothetical protein
MGRIVISNALIRWNKHAKAIFIRNKLEGKWNNWAY